MKLLRKLAPNALKPYYKRIKIRRIREQYKERRAEVNPTEEQFGIEEEIEFWSDKLRGPMFADRLVDRPLAKNFVDLIASGSGAKPEDVTVVDVGSGPLSTVGNLWGDVRIRLVPTDTLGDEYVKMLESLKITAPVPPINLEAEELTSHFQPGTVDLVVCSNALDHCRDPLAALEAMFEILKPKCSIFIWSFENEGAKERYQGMHQWDLYEERGDFVLAGPTTTESMKKRFEGRAKVRCNWFPTGPRNAGHIEAVITKLGS